MRRRRLFAAGLVMALSMVLGGRPDGAGESSRPVTEWVRRQAFPLATLDTTAPLDDLASLRQSIGDALIVGLGESVHGASEELTLKH